MAVTIAIFQEFSDPDSLNQFMEEDDILLQIAPFACPDYRGAQNNIKIFFDRHKDESVKRAYKIREQMESKSFAIFVTDQLTLREPGKKDKLIYLPKDRIIMRRL